MNSRLHPHKAWLLLFCIALLAVRISGAHWHLCYDGNEPPRAVHAWEGIVDDHTEPGHSDTNLNLVDDGVAKTFDKTFDIPVLLAVFALLGTLVLLPRRSERIAYRAPFFPPIPYSLFAQPRAPPR